MNLGGDVRALNQLVDGGSRICKDGSLVQLRGSFSVADEAHAREVLDGLQTKDWPVDCGESFQACPLEDLQVLALQLSTCSLGSDQLVVSKKDGTLQI